MSILNKTNQGCNDYAQKMPTPNGGMLAGITSLPFKPSMGAKLSKVAEIFELDIINEDEALKACKVIIGQHAKVSKGTTGTKIADCSTTTDRISGEMIQK